MVNTGRPKRAVTFMTAEKSLSLPKECNLQEMYVAPPDLVIVDMQHEEMRDQHAVMILF